MSNYPEGSDVSWAPWNQEENPDKEIEVTVSIVMSKTVKITVNDYNIDNRGIDEDDFYYEEINYSNCDLKEAVLSQIAVPQNTEEFKDWNIDDFEVIID